MMLLSQADLFLENLNIIPKGKPELLLSKMDTSIQKKITDGSLKRL